MTATADTPKPPPPLRVAGVILAGGLSRRMGGGDKALLPLGDRPMLAHVIDRLAPQVAAGAMAINANGDGGRFAAFGLPVLPDAVAGFAGPLAGVLTAMEWAAATQPEVTHVLTVGGDTPFLPPDLAARLRQATEAGATIACAASGGRRHPVVALWPVDLAAALRRALVEEHVRRVETWLDRHRTTAVDWPDAPDDPFFNVNRPDDLAAAAHRVARDDR